MIFLGLKFWLGFFGSMKDASRAFFGVTKKNRGMFLGCEKRPRDLFGHAKNFVTEFSLLIFYTHSNRIEF